MWLPLCFPFRVTSVYLLFSLLAMLAAAMELFVLLHVSIQSRFLSFLHARLCATTEVTQSCKMNSNLTGLLDVPYKLSKFLVYLQLEALWYT